MGNVYRGYSINTVGLNYSGMFAMSVMPVILMMRTRVMYSVPPVRVLLQVARGCWGVIVPRVPTSIVVKHVVMSVS